MTRHFPWTLVPGYVVARMAGASAASAVHLALFGDIARLGATVPSGSPFQALGLKVVLTLFLMFVISAVATDVRAVGQAAAIAIGGYAALVVTFAGAYLYRYVRAVQPPEVADVVRNGPFRDTEKV